MTTRSYARGFAYELHASALVWTYPSGPGLDTLTRALYGHMLATWADETGRLVSAPWMEDRVDALRDQVAYASGLTGGIGWPGGFGAVDA